MLGLIPAERWDYKISDVFRGVAAGLAPRKTTETIHLSGIGDCIPARSARAAIVTSLRALDLAPGARVGVPLYCCPVVFKAIVAAGCAPRFIDIDPATFCLSAADLFAKRA